MDKKYQGSIRRFVSVVTVVAVLGYIGSYGPSVMSWWEETWYPHGRTPSVILPPKRSDTVMLVNPLDPDAAANDEYLIPELPMMAEPEEFMPPPVAQSASNQEEDETTIDVEDASGCYVMPDDAGFLQEPIAHATRDSNDPAGV